MGRHQRKRNGSWVWLGISLGILGTATACANGQESGFGGTYAGTSSNDPFSGDDDEEDLCGNGRLDRGEECDGTRLDGETCESQGFEGGDLYCDRDCRFDTLDCFECGDGIRNGDEECDDDDFDGEDCESMGFGDEGKLSCNDECEIETESCGYECGNGVVEETEHCDGNNLDGLDCAALGYDIGELACKPDTCFYDVSACANLACGQPGESCESDTDCCGAPYGSGTCSNTVCV